MKRKPKNPITKVRTGTGDSGTTYLRVPNVSKSSDIVEFAGDLDEAMAAIAKVMVERHAVTCETVDIQITMKHLLYLSTELLFQIGAMNHNQSLVDSETHSNILDEYVEAVTAFSINISESESAKELFPPLEGFIVPNVRNADEMLARAIVRRAERSAIKSNNLWAVPALNAMSDLMFMIAWHNSPPFEQWVGIEAQDN